MFRFVYVCLLLFMCLLFCLRVALLGAWFDDLAVPRPITINFKLQYFWNIPKSLFRIQNIKSSSGTTC